MASPMSRATRQPGFFWQGLLILLPVALLAGVGMLSLRHDRLVAEHEARQRAQEIAEMLATKLCGALALTSVPPQQGIKFLLDTNSQLLFPPPCPTTPAPARFDTSLLTSNQARLWFLAQDAEVHQPQPADALQAYRDFLASDPPAVFAAAAEYSLGLLLAERGQSTEALARFQTLSEQYPGATGESGLPIEPLARLRLLETATAAGTHTVEPTRAVE